MNPDENWELAAATLRHPESAKWSRYGSDVLPLWVADMDFDIAPSIREALVERASRPLGYHLFDDPDLTRLLRAKLDALGLLNISNHGIGYLSGVVQGLFAAVLALTSVGDEVLTMTPIYPPFFSAISSHGRRQSLAPLQQTSAGWEIDFAAMEAAVTEATKLLMICHPHNPTGRVWNEKELAELADFAERHQLLVVSDELHADLTLEGEFIPFASQAAPSLQMRTVTLTGPCKAYNTAGLGIGAMISHNRDLIDRIKKSIYGLSGHPSTMSFTMWRAALRDDGRWLGEVRGKLLKNRETLTRFINQHLPGVRFFKPQATYLAWLDFRSYKIADIHKHLLEKAKVALNPGTDFGAEYGGFARLNFATSPLILDEALQRIRESLIHPINAES